jgi:acid phosphatase family membrane protein YuiD
LQRLFVNKILLTVIISLVSAQLLKVLTLLIFERKFDLRRLKGTGGMPSSHSSSVVALATSVGFESGFSGPEFAISVVLAFVVMYDACGIRRAAGEQAALLNEIIKQFSDIFKEGFEHDSLRTLLGHTVPQVFFGAILGIVISIIFYI